MRRAFAILSMVLASATPAIARAQTDGLSIRASRRDAITAASAVTAVFAVSNRGKDSVSVMPHVELPRDWIILLGGGTFEALPGQASMLVLSVAVPARAQAGIYPVRVWLTTKTDVKGTMDSVLVHVPERRALEVTLADRPGYAVGGKAYDARFLVRNRGNSPINVALSAHSTRGSAEIGDSVLALEAEASRAVRVRVRTAGDLTGAVDDVLEVRGRIVDDTLIADASARVTIVPEPGRKVEEFLKVPAQANLRAASFNGVSPLQVFGRGPVIDGSSTRVDFLFRAPTGPFSAFGEQDEYRVELAAPSWRVRAGDHFYILSPLTTSAQTGLGVGADASRGRFGLGAFSQQFRRQPGGGSEAGAFVSLDPVPGARLQLNSLQRARGISPGTVMSTSALWQRSAYRADAELARSRDGSSDGMASSLRLSGATSVISYDAGHQDADTAFAGSQRGSRHDYFTTSIRYWKPVAISANASSHSADLSRSTGAPYRETFDSKAVAATVFNQVTLELSAIDKSTATGGTTSAGNQLGARARTDHFLDVGSVSFELEYGRGRETSTAAERPFSMVSVGLQRPIPVGSVSLFASHYSGGSIMKGIHGAQTLGGDAMLHVGRRTEVTVSGFVNTLRSNPSQTSSQVDAQVAYRLPSGSSLRFRARMMNGSSLSPLQRRVGYLEYSTPFGVPVSRLRTTGRVQGRVVDAVSGRAVPSALVRLGPQIAITDRSGRVAFGGVPGGEHRLSMSQETAFTDAVFVGNPTIAVDSTRTQPTTFTLAIARSARLDVDVRRFATVKTSVVGSADSLVESGAVANATLVLIGERDTLYRTTNDDGKVTFTDVPPGQWRIVVRGDAPAFHRFDPDRMDLTLAPGEAKALSLRLIPRKREVQVIGDGQELRAIAADPKTQTAPPPVKVIKPNELRPDSKQF